MVATKYSVVQTICTNPQYPCFGVALRFWLGLIEEVFIVSCRRMPVNYVFDIGRCQEEYLIGYAFDSAVQTEG